VTLSLSARIRAHIDEGTLDIEAITGVVVREVIASGDAEGLLYPLIRGQVQTQVRAIEREAEEAVRRANKNERSAERRGHQSQDARNESMAARNNLVRTGFYAPGFGRVTWGEAVSVMHEAARDQSLKTSAAHKADADLHDWAIRQIHDAGVTCLDEIPGFTDEQLPLAA
jgi:hypothetical protein